MIANKQVQQEYRAYLERFASELGDFGFGEFAKYNGQLVQKLRFDEFEPLYREYAEMARTYIDSLERGDTINDLVAKMVREYATKLILTDPT